MTGLGWRSPEGHPLGPSPLEQCCSAESSAMMENFCICAMLKCRASWPNGYNTDNTACRRSRQEDK